MTDAIISCLIVAGASFALIGSIGLAKLPDIFMRLHGPTKATTLGVGCVLVASVIFFSANEPGITIHGLLIAVFLLMTAPVSAHLVAKAAIHRRCHCECGLPERLDVHE